MKKKTTKYLSVLFMVVTMFSCNQQEKKPGDQNNGKEEIFDPRNTTEDEEGENHKKGIEEIFDYQEAIRKPIGAEKSTYKRDYLVKEYLKAKVNSQRRTNTRAFTSSFVERGPANVPGRSRGIVVSPDNDNKWYTGSAGGGVWVTYNAGETWSSLTDYKVPNLSTSAIGVSFSSPGTIYAGTGEPFGNADAIGGIGILKTTDDGNKWDILNGTAQFGPVGRIQVNPEDASHVVVGTSTGVYLTLDGGSTWTQTYSGVNVQDLDVDPTDFDIMYASANSRGILKSTNGGMTWSFSFNKLQFNNSHQRFEMDVSPVDPSRLVVGVYTPNARASVAVNTDFYYSDDAGATYTRLDFIGSPDAANLISGQGWYNNIIMAHPFDKNIFYVGGIAVFKVNINNDNTFSFSQIASGYDEGINDYVHVDQHGLTNITEVDETFKIILANDGGIYSTNPSTTPGTTDGSWSQTVKSLNSTQFYGASKQNGKDNYIGGAQDNGSWKSTGDNTSITTEYISSGGGDGFDAIWNYQNPNEYIITSQNNFIIRNVNGVDMYAGFEDSSTENSPFISRLGYALNNPETVFAVSSRGVYKSSDFAESWKLIPISSNYANGSFGLDVKVSYANPNVVLTGSGMTETGSLSLFFSTDGGETYTATSTYTDRRGGDFAHNYLLSGMGLSPTNENRFYALFSSQGAAKVLKSDDMGTTWQDLTGFTNNVDKGFPDVAVHSIVEMPFDSQILWVGTDLGVFETTNGGNSWHLIEDLPAVSVWDMKVINNQIVISTHGRGIWSATIEELSGYEPPIYFGAPVAIFDNSYQDGFDNTDGTVEYRVTANGIASVKVLIDGEVAETVSQSFQPGESYIYNFSNLDEGIHTVGLQGIGQGGEESEIAEEELVIVNYDTPQTLVRIDEFQASDVFDFNGEFVINNLDGTLSNPILNNSDHPYVDNTQYRAIIRRPIIINNALPTLKYEDAAIIEPGPEDGFYDVVIVEASKDLKTWDLLDIYDSRRFEDWLEEYNKEGNAIITDDLIKEEEINLLNFYSPGETIALRFRLVSDPFVNSYGWGIKSINSGVTLSTNNIAPSNDKINIYPTVTKNIITVDNKTSSQNLMCDLYSINGRLIKSISINMGTNDIDVSTIPSGIYILKLSDKTKTIVKSQKIIKK